MSEWNFPSNGGSRERILTNTLSKSWWAGHIFPRDALDVLGAQDFYTKLFSRRI